MNEKPAKKAELRTRWRLALEGGPLPSLRSEGRLVALYVFLNADWASCEVKFSMRRAAEVMGVQPTTVRRGVSQLVKAGVLRVEGKSKDGNKTCFVVERCARAVRTPDTSGAQARAPLVRTPDTSRAHPAHEPCAPRAPLVRSARTRCAHNSVLSSGIPVNTSGTSSQATPATGQGPAAACLQNEEGAA